MGKSLRYKYLFSPQDWIISEKSLATAGEMLKAKVITGKATAPPPSDVMPISIDIFFNNVRWIFNFQAIHKTYL
jgi:hypothetical protein